MSAAGAEQTDWNRRILNIYWLLLGVLVAAQLLVLLVVLRLVPDKSPESYLIRYVLTPDSVLVVLLAALELMSKRLPRFSRVVIIAGASLVSFVIVSFIHPNIATARVIYILPLLVSMVYFEVRFLLWSTLGSFIYLGLYALRIPLLDGDTLTEFIVLGGSILGVCLTGIGVIRRGAELTESLERSAQSERELLIQNIVMDRMAKVDALTGLYNHKSYHEFIDRLIEHQQYHDAAVQLAVLDIDNFKQVNDTYGHSVGDIALKSAAERILEQLDAEDFAARYGGEEFVVILASKTPEAAMQVLERIRQSIESTGIEDMGGKPVTVSIGTYRMAKGDTKESAFRQADEALYEAKRTGKNKIVHARITAGRL